MDGLVDLSDLRQGVVGGVRGRGVEDVGGGLEGREVWWEGGRGHGGRFETGFLILLGEEGMEMRHA